MSRALRLRASHSAVPAPLMGMLRFEGPLRCIPPAAKRAASGTPAGYYSVEDKSHYCSLPLVLTHLFHVNSFTWRLPEQYIRKV